MGFFHPPRPRIHFRHLACCLALNCTPSSRRSIPPISHANAKFALERRNRKLGQPCATCSVCAFLTSFFADRMRQPRQDADSLANSDFRPQAAQPAKSCHTADWGNPPRRLGCNSAFPVLASVNPSASPPPLTNKRSEHWTLIIEPEETIALCPLHARDKPNVPEQEAIRGEAPFPSGGFRTSPLETARRTILHPYARSRDGSESPLTHGISNRSWHRRVSLSRVSRFTAQSVP